MQPTKLGLKKIWC